LKAATNRSALNDKRCNLPGVQPDFNCKTEAPGNGLDQPVEANLADHLCQLTQQCCAKVLNGIAVSQNDGLNFSKVISRANVPDGQLINLRPLLSARGKRIDKTETLCRQLLGNLACKVGAGPFLIDRKRPALYSVKGAVLIRNDRTKVTDVTAPEHHEVRVDYSLLVAWCTWATASDNTEFCLRRSPTLDDHLIAFSRNVRCHRIA
jgi:hypothetical protein